MRKNGTFIESIRNALSGILYFFKYEKNAKIHLLVTIMAFVLGLLLNISLIEFLFIGIAIAIVWTSELLNTALEKLYDLVEPKFNDQVKIGKDISAAAVLVSAIFSVLIGVLILGPKLVEIFLVFF